MATAAAGFAGLTSLAACDAGTPDDASKGIGAPLQVVGFNASDGGTVPADGTIQIAFNRFLAPDSVTRQSFILADGSGAVLEPVITYDPVARTVSLQNPQPAGGAWLTPGAAYYVQMNVATASDTIGLTGVKAIDGATLTTAVTETFQVVAPGTATPSQDRTIDFCDDVLPIFVSNCSGGPCHSGPSGNYQPREGLILDAPLGLANTAINQVSHESNTGGYAGENSSSTPPFGVDMPIIAPGSPGNSWLMYKILLAPNPATTTSPGLICTTGQSVPLPVSQASAANPAAPTTALSSADLLGLSNMILGEQMPYPPTGPLGLDEMERIRAWITQGASVEDCPNDCQ